MISAIALNGAGIIHDTEIAMVGRTSEDVADVLGAGAFGAAKETGEVLNQAINQGAKEEIGLGRPWATRCSGKISPLTSKACWPRPGG